MAAEENRIAHLRAIVDIEAKNAGGKTKRAGYRAVATATGLNEEYIYQLYTGRKSRLDIEAARAISRAYRNDRAEDWMDHSPANDLLTIAMYEEAQVLPFKEVKVKAKNSKKWPFIRVSLERIEGLKTSLGPDLGLQAIQDLDDLLEANILKWELRIGREEKQKRK